MRRWLYALSVSLLVPLYAATEADCRIETFETRLLAQMTEESKTLLRHVVQTTNENEKASAKPLPETDGATLTITPKNKAHAFHLYGAMYAVEGKVRLGAMLFLKASEIEPDNPLYLSEAGSLLVALGVKEGRCLVERALRHKAVSPVVSINAATVFSLEGDEARALKLLRGVVETNPGNPFFQRLLEMSLLRLALSDPKYRGVFEEIETLRKDVYDDCRDSFGRAMSVADKGPTEQIRVAVALGSEMSKLSNYLTHETVYELYEKRIEKEHEAWEKAMRPIDTVLDEIDKKSTRCPQHAMCSYQQCVITLYADAMSETILPTIDRVWMEHLKRMPYVLRHFEGEALATALASSETDIMGVFDAYKNVYLSVGLGCKLFAMDYINTFAPIANVDMAMTGLRCVKEIPDIKPAGSNGKRDKIHREKTLADLRRIPFKNRWKVNVFKADPISDLKSYLHNKKTKMCVFGQCAGFNKGVAYYEFNTPAGVSVAVGLDINKGKTVGGIGIGAKTTLIDPIADVGVGIGISGSGGSGKIEAKGSFSGIMGNINKDVSLMTMRTSIK